jgi:hypothetical protein
MTTGGRSGSFDDDELIKAEFDSMVEGLSLDESAPTTYLDELEKYVDDNRFIPPVIPKRSLRDQIKDARKALRRWKSGQQDDGFEDGSVL